MTEKGRTAEIDNELTAWLKTSDEEPREVIVEARVPQRRVRFATGTTQGPRLSEVVTEKGPSRDVVLTELKTFLTELLGRSPRVLRAAGAIPLLATREQINHIVRHPKVKAVRVNRRFK